MHAGLHSTWGCVTRCQLSVVCGEHSLDDRGLLTLRSRRGRTGLDEWSDVLVCVPDGSNTSSGRWWQPLPAPTYVHRCSQKKWAGGNTQQAPAEVGATGVWETTSRLASSLGDMNHQVLLAHACHMSFRHGGSLLTALGACWVMWAPHRSCPSTNSADMAR